MQNKSHKHSIKSSVLEKIKADKAHMKPHWHFVLKTVLTAISAAIAGLALLYLASFIVFMLHTTGVWFMPVFGFRGLNVFFASLPWMLILMCVVFVVVLELLAKHYAFTYQKPLLYSMGIIVLLTVVGSFAIMQTGMHEGFFRRAQDGNIPLVGPFYQQFCMQNFEHVYPGIIMELTGEGFIMSGHRGKIFKVMIVPETRFPLGIDFAENDPVVVLGDRDDVTIRAYGIRKLEAAMANMMYDMHAVTPYFPRTQQSQDIIFFAR